MQLSAWHGWWEYVPSPEATAAALNEEAAALARNSGGAAPETSGGAATEPSGGAAAAADAADARSRSPCSGGAAGPGHAACHAHQ